MISIREYNKDTTTKGQPRMSFKVYKDNREAFPVTMVKTINGVKMVSLKGLEVHSPLEYTALWEVTDRQDLKGYILRKSKELEKG